MRPESLLAPLLLAAGLLGVLPGCAASSAAGRGLGALFSSPKKVEPNRHPVGKDARLAVVWVGHATALVQIEDKVILTDPVFTDTVGQLAKRLVEPGIRPADLPPVDAVLISHLHYDHLSLGSLEQIAPKVRTLLMPTTGTAYLTDFAFPAYELATWQAWEKDGLRITAVPVRHAGWRYGLDGEWMTTGATAYVIEYKGLKVYFGGDSAYDQAAFVETGQRFPDLDVALVPIAPIAPRDFMRTKHMDPREALQAFVDLGARTMVPIHYDTFVNSEDRPGDALRVLGEAQRRYYLVPRVVAPLAVGERRVFLKAGEPKPGPLAAEIERASAPAAKPSAEPAPTVPDDDKFD